MSSALQGALIGAIAGLVTVVVMGLVVRRKCPDCGEKLPALRRPSSAQQAVWGGWTCPKCGCEVDRKGRKRDAAR
ncbi:MAG TPA: hypothetical protein VFF06_29930 [Polyangia bacterium]|nr:hypothetical protein [Polyangia bacterium]